MTTVNEIICQVELLMRDEDYPPAVVYTGIKADERMTDVRAIIRQVESLMRDRHPPVLVQRENLNSACLN